MLPFGVTIPATVPQRSEIPEGLMNYSVYLCSLWKVAVFDNSLFCVTGKGSNEEVFLGTESPPSQSASVSFSDQAVIRVECRPGDEEVREQKHVIMWIKPLWYISTSTMICVYTFRALCVMPNRIHSCRIMMALYVIYSLCQLPEKTLNFLTYASVTRVFALYLMQVLE